MRLKSGVITLSNPKKVKKEQIQKPLKGAVEYIDKAIFLKDGIANSIQGEDYKKAFEKFENLLESLDYLNDLLDSVETLLKLNYQQLMVESNSIDENIKEFNSFLQEVMTAMKDQDYLLVADLIEFELEEYLRSYKKIFIFLDEYVEGLEDY